MEEKNSRGRTVRRILSAVVCFVLIVAVLAWATFVLERKKSYHKLSPFFREEQDYDVLFLGSSHMINGVLPMQLWDEYGITSYNLGGHAATLPLTYWTFRLAMERHCPETVVIDCKALESETKTPETFSYVHQIMDQMPFSLTKIAAVTDLLNDPNMTEQQEGEERTALSLLWSFSAYHRRWDELGQGDFVVTSNRQKGAEMKCRYGTPQKTEQIPDDEVLKGETVGTEYLRKIIGLCRERGINVILVFLPFPAAEEDQRSANTMEKIAAEYGIPAVNFLKEDVIRYDTDMADADSHVNYSGAQKLTTWIGQYLRDNLDVPDRREDPRYASWNDDYQDFQGDAVKLARESKSLEEYLLMLTNPHTDTIIEVYDRSVYRNKDFIKLLENLGADPDELNENADLIAILEGKEATVCHFFKKNGVAADTVLGRLSYRTEDRGEENPVPYYVVSRDGEELYALERTANRKTDLRVRIFEHDTGRLLLHSNIRLKTPEDFGDGTIELYKIENVK